MPPDPSIPARDNPHLFLPAYAATTTASANALLGGLSLSAGSLSPSFAGTTLSYTATIKVNGNVVASGAASGAMALSVGSTTRTYTVVATRAAATVGSCTLTATETAGPYPLLAILSNTAIVRSNMTEGKTGVPLTLTLTLTLTVLNASCTPIVGAAVYIWHCDKDGLYSGYSTSGNAGQAGLTYLRGIQVTDSNGQVAFTTVYPGWYIGRITHVHAQIYLNDNLAVTATATTQLAFPLATTTAVYNSSLYTTHGQNTSVTSFSADNVFSDGTSTEMLSIDSGSTGSGFVASMTINIAG